MIKHEIILLPPGAVKERIVMPTSVAGGLLFHLHNHEFQEHPARSQLKASFNRRFTTFLLDAQLDRLYDLCYQCIVHKKLPPIKIANEQKAEVQHPHRFFHADVIKRETQNILIVTDHFSSLQSALIVTSEKAEDLKNGLVILTSTMRYPGPIEITVDNAPGFNSLIQQKDTQLDSLKIKLNKTDALNKNANAVVDRGYQELEEELRKLAPNGGKITQATLTQAVLAVNSKLRRNNKLSAYEMHTSRDMFSGENLFLSDQDLRQQQLDTRAKNKPVSNSAPEKVEAGDTVTPLVKQPKHTAREMFLVTKVSGENISAQKILHPLSKRPTKLMSKIYNTQTKRLKVVHRPNKMDPTIKTKPLSTTVKPSGPSQPADPSKRTDTPSRPWSLVNDAFYNMHISDDEDDDPPRWTSNAMMRKGFNLMKNTKKPRTCKQISRMMNSKMMKATTTEAKMMKANMTKRCPCLMKTQGTRMMKNRNMTRYLRPPGGGDL